MDDLVTVNEVAEAIGVTRQRVHQLMTKDVEDPLPGPVISKSNGWIQLWDMRQVRRWAKRNGYPKPSTPSTTATS